MHIHYLLGDINCTRSSKQHNASDANLLHRNALSMELSPSLATLMFADAHITSNANCYRDCQVATCLCKCMYMQHCNRFNYQANAISVLYSVDSADRIKQTKEKLNTTFISCIQNNVQLIDHFRLQMHSFVKNVPC